MGEYAIGMVGMGTMGGNLALNMADHGHKVAGYMRNPHKAAAFRELAAGKTVFVTTDLAEMIGKLSKPRAVMLLVPAGATVDEVIAEVQPLLEPGDLIIDGGNSHFSDTERRHDALSPRAISYLGLGISGGEDGARLGPSMMAGGDHDAYEIVRKILEDVAAKASGQPCVALLGPNSAGHFVKMVHNGIEYAIMQAIAEVYDALRRGAGMSIPDIGNLFDKWDDSILSSFLVEITAKVLALVDDQTGKPLVESVIDAARQKGTGRWTTMTAMEFHVPAPSIDAAVSARDISFMKAERLQASNLFSESRPSPSGKISEKTAESALFVGMLAAFAQGMALLQVASDLKGYDLSLETVARIWREGCIIRSKLLAPIRHAFHSNPGLTNLMLDQELRAELLPRMEGLREFVAFAATHGIPAPTLSATLSYIDGYTTELLPANLTQAQRDAFGAHTYERIDREGYFHTDWLGLHHHA